MLFAGIEHSIARLEYSMWLCFMIFFKLDGLLTCSWWIIVWPIYVPLIVAMIRKYKTYSQPKE